MAKLDLAKGFKRIQDSAKEIQTAVQDKRVPDIKLPEIKIPEFKADEIKLPDAKEMTEGIKSAAENVRSVLTKKDKTPEKEERREDNRVLATDAALKIIYFAMTVDGKIESEENDLFLKLGREMDPKFEEHKEKIIAECKKVMATTVDDDDYYDVLQDGVTLAIDDSAPTQDSYITPKILLWNLLTVVYSDGDCSQDERRLIKYIVRKLSIDKSVFLELESSMRTIMDIEKEIAWIKTTDRQYMEIEKIVNELTDRRNVVFDSVKDLITL